MSEGTGHQLTTVKCEKHGLRYNPAIHSGCVRCRKEAGERIGGAAGGRPAGSRPARGRPAGRGVAAGRPPAGGAGALIPSLAVAVALVAAAGGGFFWMHQRAYDAFQRSFSGEAGELGFEGSFEEMFDEEALEELELTPEEREQLEELRDELEKVVDDPDG